MNLPVCLAAASPGETLAGVLLYVVLGLLGAAGLGAAVATLRVILPGLAGLADGALVATRGRRLFLMGLLPLLGVGLLANAVGQAQHETLGALFGILVLVPTGLLVLLGLLAALPHLGERLLERDRPRSPLARSAGGGVALGLSATTIWIPQLFALLLLLVGGWLLGIGLSAALGRRTPVAPAP